MKLKQMRFVTANHDEILNTWLKFFITWLHESQFMNVLFIRIEILKCHFAFSLSQYISSSTYHVFRRTLDVNIQNKSVYNIHCYDISLN